MCLIVITQGKMANKQFPKMLKCSFKESWEDIWGETKKEVKDELFLRTLGEPSVWRMTPAETTTTTTTACFTLTGEDVFDGDLCHVGSHTEIASIACSRSEVLLLSIRQGFLRDLVEIERAGKTRPCCRRGNGKMLLGASQEVWTPRCVRATQRKRGKSSRWPSDASFISESHNNGKSLLSSSNIQRDKQGGRVP